MSLLQILGFTLVIVGTMIHAVRQIWAFLETRPEYWRGTKKLEEIILIEDRAVDPFRLLGFMQFDPDALPLSTAISTIVKFAVSGSETLVEERKAMERIFNKHIGFWLALRIVLALCGLVAITCIALLGMKLIDGFWMKLLVVLSPIYWFTFLTFHTRYLARTIPKQHMMFKNIYNALVYRCRELEGFYEE